MFEIKPQSKGKVFEIKPQSKRKVVRVVVLLGESRPTVAPV